MHTTDEQAWDRSDLQQEVEVENVEDHRADRPRATIDLVIRHPDVSETISLGPWELSVSLGLILQTLETSLPDLLCDLEAGVPKTRRATLSRADIWRPVPREGMVIEVLVRDSAVGR